MTQIIALNLAFTDFAGNDFGLDKNHQLIANYILY